MSLNIKQARQSGFTIVELLIVVVVIAILAAIVIVSYNGITTQANDSAAAAAASTFQKKAELYLADTGSYPTQASDLTNSEKPYHLTSGFTYGATSTVAEAARKNTAVVRTCVGTGSPAPVTGLRIHFYDFTDGGWTSNEDSITVGTGTCAAI